MKPNDTHGVTEAPAPKRHALCGKCMTPHICAEDGPGCKLAPGMGEAREKLNAIRNCAHIEMLRDALQAYMDAVRYSPDKQGLIGAIRAADEQARKVLEETK